MATITVAGSRPGHGARLLGRGPAAALALLLALASLAAWARVAWAQGAIARVAVAQRVVEKSGPATAFARVGPGAPLGVGDSLRTGKRSKADMKFADGSLVRLGQLSSIELSSARGVRLSGGRLLFAALRPGRVLAGNGTAEIKGSVAVIALERDGSGEFTLYSGAMDVSGDRTVSLLPGQSVRVDPQGRLSRVRRAPPFGFLGGELDPDLLTTPEPGPFTGGEVNQKIREGADRTAVDQLLPLSVPQATDANGIPRGQPFPTPFPTPGAAQARVAPLAPSISSASGSESPASAPSTDAAPRLSWSRSLAAGSPSGMLGSRLAQASPEAPAPDAAAPAQAQAPERALEAPASTSTAGAEAGSAEELLADFDLDTRPALDHIDEVDRSRGRFFDADARAVGAASNDAAGIYGARLRGFGAVGQAYFEATLAPLQLRDEGDSSDYSSLATGFVLLRDARGEVRVGRQRFVSGPTQAAFFGSLVRQGGRETMDAIRISPRLGRGVQLEAAYIHDAFPRNLPFQIGGAQKAFYGRAALRRRSFALGLNALRYAGSAIDPALDATTGATVDFALPIVRDEVEFYGEVGRDPFRRRLRTFGLGFPGLYERTDFDAFLEYARLSESARATNLGAPPSEVTLRVYRRVGRSVNTITSLSRFGGGAGWSLAVGIAIGGSRNTRYGNLP